MEIPTLSLSHRNRRKIGEWFGKKIVWNLVWFSRVMWGWIFISKFKFVIRVTDMVGSWNSFIPWLLIWNHPQCPHPFFVLSLFLSLSLCLFFFFFCFFFISKFMIHSFFNWLFILFFILIFLNFNVVYRKVKSN